MSFVEISARRTLRVPRNLPSHVLAASRTQRAIRGVANALLAALLLTFSGTISAGVADVSSAKTVVPEKKPEANPLCFADGKICIDINERIRFEARENTFDFNSAVDSLTDDAFFLQRFRIGLAYKPTDWLKFYVQGQ